MATEAWKIRTWGKNNNGGWKVRSPQEGKKGEWGGPDKAPPILLSPCCFSEQKEKEGMDRKGGWGGQVAELLDKQCLFSPILIYEVVLFRRSVGKQATLWHRRPLLFPLLYFQTEHCARVIWQNRSQGRKGEGALMEAWVGHFSLTLGEEKERGSGEPLSEVQSSSSASGGMAAVKAANREGYDIGLINYLQRDWKGDRYAWKKKILLIKEGCSSQQGEIWAWACYFTVL